MGKGLKVNLLGDDGKELEVILLGYGGLVDFG